MDSSRNAIYYRISNQDVGEPVVALVTLKVCICDLTSYEAKKDDCHHVPSYSRRRKAPSAMKHIAQNEITNVIPVMNIGNFACIRTSRSSEVGCQPFATSLEDTSRHIGS